MKKLFFLLCATTLILVARAEAGGVWSDQYCNIETQTIITKDTNGKIISE